MSGPYNLNNPNTMFVHKHPNATTTEPGAMSSADKTKLDGVQTGATQNSTDAQLRDRATHTGEQPISSVTDLANQLSGKQASNVQLDAISAISGTGLLRKTGASSWSLDSASYLTGNQTVTFTGDASGSGSTAVTLTLANSGVGAGTYKSVTVDAKGRVTAGTNPTTLSGYGITDAQPLDATLTALAGLSTTADRFIFFTGTDVASLGTITSFGRSLIDDADATAARATLGLGTAATQPSTAFQAADNDLTAIAGLAGTNGILRKTATDTWSLDTASYLTGNQTVTFTGDATGSGSTAVTLTLSNSGVGAGTYPKVTVDAKGRVTAGSSLVESDIPALSASKITSGVFGAAQLPSGTTSASGIVQLNSSTSSTSTTTAATPSAVKSAYDLAAAAIPLSQKGVANGVATLDSNGFIPAGQLPSYVDDVIEGANLAAFPGTGETGKIYVAIDTGAIYRWSGSVYVNISSAGVADTANTLVTPRTISTTGDATWSVTFDGSTNVSSPITLANSGVGAGTYKSVTVDAKGRVTAGTNPTTLSGYGITDAQPLDATLTAVAGVTTSANSFIYFTGADVATSGTITSFGRSLIDDADATTARTTLGLGTAATQPSTAFQSADADLTAIAGLAGTNGLLRKTAADTWSLDTASYITGNQTITFSGDATGSGSTAVTLTLNDTGVTGGTYKSVTVDAKGRVTAGTNPTTLTGYGITDAQPLSVPLTKYVDEFNSATVQDGTIIYHNNNGSTGRVATVGFARLLLESNQEEAKQLLEIPTEGFGSTDTMDNWSQSTLKMMKVVPTANLDFFNNEYHIGMDRGLELANVDDLLFSSRSPLGMEAVDRDDGIATFHSFNGVHNTITSTVIPGLYPSVGNLDYQLGGIYEYRGSEGLRVERLHGAKFKEYSDIPRFDTIGGLLIEPTSQNLVSFYDEVTSNTTFEAENFEHTPMSMSTGNVLAQLLPQFSHSISENTANAGHYVYYPTTSNVTSGLHYTGSVYVNFNNASTVYLQLSNTFASQAHCVFTVSYTNGSDPEITLTGGNDIVHCSAVGVGSGWHRLSITAIANSTGIAHLRLGFESPSAVYVGNTLKRVYFWGVQIENQQIPSSYIYPIDSVKSVRGSDTNSVHVDTVGTPARYNDVGCPSIKRHSGWIVLNIDRLMDYGGDHALLSLWNANDSSTFATVYATIDNNTQITFTITSIPNDVVETVSVPFGYENPISCALYYNSYRNIIRVVFYQEGVSAYTVTLPNSVSIVPTYGINGFEIGSNVETTNNPLSSFNCDSMWGWVRSMQTYSDITDADIELLLTAARL